MNLKKSKSVVNNLKKMDANKIECIRDVTDSPKDWEDFWYSPEAQGTWGSDTFEEVWETMDKIEPLTPPTNK